MTATFSLILRRARHESITGRAKRLPAIPSCVGDAGRATSFYSRADGTSLFEGKPENIYSF